MEQLEKIASGSDWAGYFGSPGLASASLGRKEYERWIIHGNELVTSIVGGKNYRNQPRLGDVDDPADAAAVANNDRLERQHEAWILKTTQGLK